MNQTSNKTKVILASTSPFRREILAKLAIDFDAIAPHCDETPKPDETPTQLVERLAVAKAQSVANTLNTQAPRPNTLVIGSDQVAVHLGKIIGKPHTKDNAIKQLSNFSGQAITFYTGLCVYQVSENNLSATKYLSEVVPFTVHFRNLSRQQIEYYIDKEQPLNCAGSFKSEGLGISLFSRLEGDDPNTLIGLPLIRLIDLFNQFGLDVLNPIK